jgi:NTP pyrophosphatase (non-canonical NTP hydrolase)
MNDDTIEILLILQEECAEVSQAISKCFRFGPDQCKPDSDETNIQALEHELGDIQAMIELLIKTKAGVTANGIATAKKKKFEKLKRWSNIKINK